MMFYILFSTFVLLGVIIFIVSLVIDVDYKTNEFVAGFGLTFAMLSLLFLLMFTSIHLIGKNDYKKKYKQMVDERDIIELKLNQAIEIDNWYLIHLSLIEVEEFNKEINSHREKIDSIWIGILYNRDIANIELIEIKKEN